MRQPISEEVNRIYFLLEGIEAAFMRAFVCALLMHVKPVSLVFIHDGLLVSSEPSRVHLDSSLSLGFDPPPGFRVQTANLHHDQSCYQGSSHSHVEVRAQVTSGPAFWSPLWNVCDKVNKGKRSCKVSRSGKSHGTATQSVSLRIQFIQLAPYPLAVLMAYHS